MASCVIIKDDGELFFEEECFFVVDAGKPECPVVLMDDSELIKVSPDQDSFLAELKLKN